MFDIIIKEKSKIQIDRIYIFDIIDKQEGGQISPHWIGAKGRNHSHIEKWESVYKYILEQVLSNHCKSCHRPNYGFTLPPPSKILPLTVICPMAKRFSYSSIHAADRTTRRNSDETRSSKNSFRPVALKLILRHLVRGEPDIESDIGHIGYGDRSGLS